MASRARAARRATARARAVPPAERNWAYFIDVDGTLVPIAPRPSDARVGRDMHRLIIHVHRATGGALALLSGRAIDDVDAIFRHRILPIAGLHGIERRGAGGRLTQHGPAPVRLDGAREELAGIVARHAGLLLEDKGRSLALHYRQAPRLASYAHRVMRALAAHTGPAYELQRGKKVIELKPAGWSKGDAVRAFMRERPFRGRRPVFIGDDTTDEHGFAAVNALGGHSIKVGRGPTCATWRLTGVSAVHRWLEPLDARRAAVGTI